MRPPGLWSSAWTCAEHGSVAPLHVLLHPGQDALDHVSRLAAVPVWLPVGLASGWTCSGIAFAGDERDGARAAVTAFSGPGPLGGGADLLLVAEEPGVGLAAHLAGTGDVDAGDRIASGPPDGQVLAARHPTALWPLPGSGGTGRQAPAAFVGEGKGFWLWLVLWPATAGVMVYDGLELVDHREDASAAAELAFGALTPRLTAGP